jgi:hypothetical protein
VALVTAQREDSRLAAGRFPEGHTRLLGYAGRGEGSG